MMTEFSFCVNWPFREQILYINSSLMYGVDQMLSQKKFLLMTSVFQLHILDSVYPYKKCILILLSTFRLS